MDDKIILRARRNHLLVSYREAAQVRGCAQLQQRPCAGQLAATHMLACHHALLPLLSPIRVQRASERRPCLLPTAPPAAAPPQSPAQVFADASGALAAAVEKQRGKVAEAEAALAEAAGDSGGAAEKRREELATNLAQEQMLVGKAEAAAAALAAAGAGAPIAQQLEIAGDALAEALDRQLGATVTDPAIFRTHAAK